MEKHKTEIQTERLAELEKVLAHKTAIAERLIADKDKIIERELRRYDEAAFYIHLQSRCFKLYPLAVRILLGMIDYRPDRSLFCTIVGGKDLRRFAQRNSITPQEAVKRFDELVKWLNMRIKRMVSLIETKGVFDTLEGRIAELNKKCYVREEEVHRLTQQLAREVEVRNELVKKNARLQVEMNELTRPDGMGFLNRLLWLIGH